MRLPTAGFVAATLMCSALVVAPPGLAFAKGVTSGHDAGFGDAERPAGTVVLVDSSLDTDDDGKKDTISIEVVLPKEPKAAIPAIIEMSPYLAGLNDVPNHGVDSDLLPQENLPTERQALGHTRQATATAAVLDEYNLLNSGYAVIRAHSLGTGPSQGCPTTGDRNEGLAAAAIVDWLNGRAPGFDKAGNAVSASWSNGLAGMTGVSYNGTLANMAAITGVEGLKAIVPIASISSWYDYYRANGLVVAPGGYQGEDADVMAKAVANKPCQKWMDAISTKQDRITGDYNAFWHERDYTVNADKVKAAVFIVHGMTDWNVRGRQAIQWYEALRQHGVDTKLWLHNADHRPGKGSEYTVSIQQFWDKHLKGIVPEQPVGSRVTVERPDNTLAHYNDWDDNSTSPTTLHFSVPTGSGSGELVTEPGKGPWQSFVDAGKGPSMLTLAGDPMATHPNRLMFVGQPLPENTRLSGTPNVTLTMRLPARKAANVSVGLVSVAANGKTTVLTRGWVDPQNANQLHGAGQTLVPGQSVAVTFPLEPKDLVVPAGSRLAVLVMATDPDFTLRPAAGTVVEVDPAGSSVTVRTGKP